MVTAYDPGTGKERAREPAENADPETTGRPNIPLGRPGHAREISHRVASLASEKSFCAAGGSYVLDGGLTLVGAGLGSG